MEEVVRSGRPVHREEESRSRVFDTRCIPLEGSSGQVRRLALYANDITEQKRTEQALREKELRLREAQEIAHIGSWNWDLQTGELAWSDEMYRIHQADPKSHGNDVQALLQQMIHPEDVQRTQTEPRFRRPQIRPTPATPPGNRPARRGIRPGRRAFPG